MSFSTLELDSINQLLLNRSILKSSSQEIDNNNSIEADLLLLPEQLDQLKEIYNFYCDKKTKNITSKSLYNILTKIGINNINEIKCTQMISEWSDSGVITFAEFLCLFSLGFKTSSCENDLKVIFNLLDIDKIGMVKISHLLQVITNLEPSLTNTQINDLVLTAFPEQASNFRNFYQDGYIDYTEFIKMMTQ